MNRIRTQALAQHGQLIVDENRVLRNVFCVGNSCPRPRTSSEKDINSASRIFRLKYEQRCS
jgi:hypothetical protein